MPNLESYQDLIQICREYGATLVAVSKTRTESEIMSVYNLGQRMFGENRAHELIIKAELLPRDIEWHLIGHLQTNKVKSILPYVSCIQSLDSLKLWQKLDEEAKEANMQIDCLLQIRVAVEETKYGWEKKELDNMLSSGLHLAFSNINICGVMGMASLTNNTEQVRQEMKLLKDHYDSLKETYFKTADQFNILSMGMSGDYEIALKEGSTMIRVGSMIFL
ncbi:MAG TPA: YggS family pyridoxal phosphate-dependent enzyme [Saprospiraceae bacterium]|nr:YggS family pyridoxal phosphate-dependent enzyme [Saprospiraceae bacterium]